MEVHDSAAYGIFLEGMNQSVSLNNIKVENNNLDGIHISSYKETGTITDISAKGIIICSIYFVLLMCS